MSKPKDGKKVISFYITEESIQKLKDLTEIEQRSKGNEIEFLINQRWNDLKKNIESYKKGEFRHID